MRLAPIMFASRFAMRPALNSFTSCCSINAGNEPRSPAHIGSIGGKSLAEHALFVMHTRKLRRDRERDHENRPGV
jgi:hypothetical protein